jgi:chemotaxis protein CheX
MMVNLRISDEGFSMDVKYINPFLRGTLEVLKKMAFIEPLPGKPYLKKNSLAQGDVSGIVGITGDMTGSLAISFSEPCICQLVGNIIGEHYSEANQDVFDGVGEITNMISGVARTLLEKEGMQVNIAIPAVVYGKDHTITHILKSPSIIIPFNTDKGSFVIDVCIKKSDDAQSAPIGFPALHTKPPIRLKEPEVQSIRAGHIVLADEAMDKKKALSNKLSDIAIIRDDIRRQLDEQPFMDVSMRQRLKKRHLALEAQAKRLRLDLNTMEMLSRISSDDLENPKIAMDYQHYDTKKKKT